MFIDLRNSTGLASGRLPFDAIFFVDRYIQAVTAAIQANAGSVTSVAGDGIMSVFGLDGDAAAAARNALTAAESIWRLIDRLSADFAEELGALKFGIGLHTGLSVIGKVGLPGQTSIQFLGDTGNIASRLESLTKETACTMIVSASTIAAAGMSPPRWLTAHLEICGRSEPLPAFLVFLMPRTREPRVDGKQRARRAIGSARAWRELRDHCWRRAATPRHHPVSRATATMALAIPRTRCLALVQTQFACGVIPQVTPVIRRGQDYRAA